MFSRNYIMIFLCYSYHYKYNAYFLKVLLFSFTVTFCFLQITITTSQFPPTEIFKVIFIGNEQTTQVSSM